MVIWSKIFSLLGAILYAFILAMGIYLLNNGTDMTLIKELATLLYVKPEELLQLGSMYMIYGSMLLLSGLFGLVCNIYTIIKLFRAKDRRELAIPIVLQLVAGNILCTILMINIKDSHFKK